MNLYKPKNSQRWKNQLKRLSDCTENLFTKNLEETAINCKYFLSDIGQINYFCDEELKTAVIQADVSVDGSWKSIGWRSEDSILDICFGQTGKILGVLYKTSKQAMLFQT